MLKELAGIATSLRVAGGVARISSATVFDALLGRVRQDVCNERLAWWARSSVNATRTQVHVDGQSHVGSEETFVVMSNHQSHYDIPFLLYAIPGTLRMVAKSELFRVPIWGNAMRQSGFIEIDRSDRKKAIRSLRAARSALQQGVHVWIAPEGTRSRTGELLPFKKGGFLLAMETKLRILPVGIFGTRDVLQADALLSQRHQHVGIAIGQPISVVGKNRNALLAETREKIASLVQHAETLR